MVGILQSELSTNVQKEKYSVEESGNTTGTFCCEFIKLTQ